MQIKIRPYGDKDQTGWLRCRVLSFLDTGYFDNVLPEKEQYSCDSIELVAEEKGAIIGLIDFELNADLCSGDDVKSAMIWHVAVYPDHQRWGIGKLLLSAAEELARVKGISKLEVYTRDDEWVKDWYINKGLLNLVSTSTYTLLTRKR